MRFGGEDTYTGEIQIVRSQMEEFIEQTEEHLPDRFTEVPG